MTMQKDKGKAFENKIANYIHEKLLAGCPEYKNYYETLGNTNLKPRREKSSGTTKDCDNDIDMGLALKYMPLSIECKHHASINKVTLNALLAGDITFFEKTYKQANTHAKLRNLTPLIVFRGNRTINMICMNMAQFVSLGLYADGKNFIICKDLIFMSLDDFMERFLLRYV